MTKIQIPTLTPVSLATLRLLPSSSVKWGHSGPHVLTANERWTLRVGFGSRTTHSPRLPRKQRAPPGTLKKVRYPKHSQRSPTPVPGSQACKSPFFSLITRMGTDRIRTQLVLTPKPKGLAALPGRSGGWGAQELPRLCGQCPRPAAPRLPVGLRALHPAGARVARCWLRVWFRRLNHARKEAGQ